MPLKLKVSYSEKDIVKSKKGRWDVENKCWYVPDNLNYSDFREWFFIQNPSKIIKEIYYILLGSRMCWKCSQQTKVIALAASKHLSINNNGEYEFSSSFVRFGFIKWLPNDIIKEIQSNFISFKYRFSNTIKEKYWGNNCEKCDAIQGDFFNNHEIGGAFYPQNEFEAKKIKLIEIKTKFDIPIIASEVDVLHKEVIEAKKILNPVNVTFLIMQNAQKIDLNNIKS